MNDHNTVGTITMTFDIPQQYVDDICSCALEGGINYWCSKVTNVNFPDGLEAGTYTSDLLTRGGNFALVEDDGGKKHTLTLAKFLKGFELACKHFGQTPEKLYEDHDAEVADVVVQFALFGEIIYG